MFLWIALALPSIFATNSLAADLPGGRSIFMRNFMVARYNDHGDYIPSLLLTRSFLKQHLGKLIGRPA